MTEGAQRLRERLRYAVSGLGLREQYEERSEDWKVGVCDSVVDAVLRAVVEELGVTSETVVRLDALADAMDEDGYGRVADVNVRAPSRALATLLEASGAER